MFYSIYNLGPRHEKTCLRGFANNTGADQPVHLRSLISAFFIRLLDSVIYRHATSAISLFLASLCSLGDCFESHFIGNPEDRFCRNEAHLRKESVDLRGLTAICHANGLSQTEPVLFSRKVNKPVHPPLYMNHKLINEMTNHKYLGYRLRAKKGPAPPPPPPPRKFCKHILS